MITWIERFVSLPNVRNREQSIRSFRPEIEDRLIPFGLAVGGMITLLPILLLAIEQFSYQTYFVLCFLWFLACVEVLTPTIPRSVWWRRITWVKLLGWIVFAVIIAERFHLIS